MGSNNRHDTDLPPNEHWDDEMMWNDIEQELDKDKKRYGFIWFVLGISLVGAMIAVMPFTRSPSMSEGGEVNIENEEVNSNKDRSTTYESDGINEIEDDNSIPNVNNALKEIAQKESVQNKNAIKEKEIFSSRVSSFKNQQETNNSETEKIKATAVVSSSLRSSENAESMSGQSVGKDLIEKPTPELVSDGGGEILARSITKKIKYPQLTQLTLIEEKIFLLSPSEERKIIEIDKLATPEKRNSRSFYSFSAGYGKLNSVTSISGPISELTRFAQDPFYSLDMEVSYARYVSNKLFIESGINVSRQLHRFRAEDVQIKVEEILVDTAVIIEGVNPIIYSGYVDSTTIIEKKYKAFNRFYQVSLPVRIGYEFSRKKNTVHLSTGTAINLVSSLKGYAFGQDEFIVPIADIPELQKRKLSLKHWDIGISYSRDLSQIFSVFTGLRYVRAFNNDYVVDFDSDRFSTKSSSLMLRAGVLYRIN